MILKPFLEHIEIDGNSSVKVKTYTQQLIDVPLHYHPEHEIVYIQKGRGKLFIADVEEDFNRGELFFLRGSIPHLFEDEGLYTGRRIHSRVAVIQYKQTLFENFYHLPEFQQIKKLQLQLGYGIRMRTTTQICKLIAALEKKTSLLKFNALIALLNEIVNSKGLHLIGPSGPFEGNTHVAYLRLQKMHGFLSNYFHKDLNIEEVASLLHMSKTSLCRFLKRETGKTFSEHLNFYRINQACTLLRDSTDSVTQICFATGFNNAAYFFRQFKKLKQMSPMEYRLSHR